MIRQCFLCGSEIQQLFSDTWTLPGLPQREIGFSVCSNCGSVSQSPTVTFDEMMTYYESIVVYTNPGRNEKPSIAKIRDLDEQLQLIKRAIGELPQSTLQIGSSDGYTLSRFREAGVKRVFGVEPGSESVELAKRLYDIDCFHGTAEELETDEQYELILMTHVLEHLYNPQEILRKCYELQRTQKQGHIYIEVPLLSLADSLPPGFFSFEHINYYTRNNLQASIEQAGYSIISVVEHYKSNLSPVIGMVASINKQQLLSPPQNDYEQNRKNVLQYRVRETATWQEKVDALNDPLIEAKRTFLWGAGIHTSQLVANTDLLKRVTIHGLVDTSHMKWNIRQGDWICQDPKTVDWQVGDAVIISSYASEQEIYEALQWLREKGVNTLRLHNIYDSKAH